MRLLTCMEGSEVFNAICKDAPANPDPSPREDGWVLQGTAVPPSLKHSPQPSTPDPGAMGQMCWHQHTTAPCSTLQAQHTCDSMSHFPAHQQQYLFLNRLVLLRKSEIQGKSQCLSCFQTYPNPMDTSQLPTPETDQEVQDRDPKILTCA